MARQTMRKIHCMRFHITVLLGLALLWAFPAFATTASPNPITATISVQPSTLPAPGTVSVTINVVNTSEDSTPVSVTLYDPNEQIVSGFGSGGTASLAPNGTASYTGSWEVTQEQLDNRRLAYSIKYMHTDEEGRRIPVTIPLGEEISQNEPVPALVAERAFDPGTTVQEGQTVTIHYLVKNTGTVDVERVIIRDPKLTSEVLTYGPLPAGESTDMTFSFTAGTESVQTQGEISFEYYAGGELKTAPTEVSPERTVNVTVPNLSLVIEGNQMVSAGDKVDITWKINNRSDLSYEQIRITDPLLGDVAQNISVGAQRSVTEVKSITVSGNATYQFALSGVDGSGNNIMVLSNELTIQTIESRDATVPTGTGGAADLTVQITPDRTVIYEQPSEVVFQVEVTNNGLGAAQDITLRAAEMAVRTIDRIEPGETVTVKLPLMVSVGGTFQFEAVMENAEGEEIKAESNSEVIGYVYIAPTPAPTPQPTEPPMETAPPSEQPDDPFGQEQAQQQSGGIGSTVLYILGALLVLVLIGVAALLITDMRKRSSRGGSGGAAVKVIDSIERTPHREYNRPARKSAPPSSRRKAETTPEAPAAEPNEASNRPDDLDWTPPGDTRDDASPNMRVYDMSDYGYPSDAPAISEQEEEAPAWVPPSERRSEGRVADFDEPVSRQPEPEADRESMYRRPKPAPKPALDDADTDDEEETSIKPEHGQEEETIGQSDPFANTAVFSATDYLSRIRSESEEAAPAEPVSASEPEKGAGRPTQAEEDAALRNGGTGTYRLSRPSASVRSADKGNTALPRVEDPETFARKRRMERTQKPKPDADANRFYEDNEDE